MWRHRMWEGCYTESYSFPAEIHEHGSPSPPALQARQSPRPKCGYGFSAAISTETATIYLRSFSCFRCFLHTSALASRFSPLASRFSLLASCPRSKPSDTFGYCPSTRCNKITRRNIGFWAFGEGDARARGAMLWRPVGPREQGEQGKFGAARAAPAKRTGCSGCKGGL